MSDPNQPLPSPGWYADPQGTQRWWDGTQWTEHTQPVAGQSPYGNQPQYGGYNAPPKGGKGKLVAIIGGAVGVLVVATVLIVVAVKALGSASPEGVAMDYLSAIDLSDPDFAQRCELSTKESRELLLKADDAKDCAEFTEIADAAYAEHVEDGFEGCDVTYGDAYDDLKLTNEITKVDETETEAVVDYEVITEFTGNVDDYADCADLSEDDFEKNTDKGTLLLCLEDEEWKVSSTYYDEEANPSCDD